MLKITGRDAEVTLTDTYVRLTFDLAVATTDKLSVSPRDVPLTSIEGVELCPRAGLFSGTFRLILFGDTTEPQPASWDINTHCAP